LRWSSVVRVSSTGPVSWSSSSPTISVHCCGRLALAVDRLRHALAERPVVVDQRVADFGEGQPAQAATAASGDTVPVADPSISWLQPRLVHPPILSARDAGSFWSRIFSAQVRARSATRTVGGRNLLGTDELAP
jgi:hypothetical protein